MENKNTMQDHNAQSEFIEMFARLVDEATVGEASGHWVVYQEAHIENQAYTYIQRFAKETRREKR